MHKKNGILLRAVLASTAMAGAGLALGPTPATAAILTAGAPNGPYGGYVCADVVNNHPAAGTLIQDLACHGGANQDFELIGTTIYALSGTRCMDVEGNGAGGAAGTPIDSYTCTGGKNQEWYYYFGQLINVQYGLCLDATSLTNGTTLVVNPCNNTVSQQWQFK